MSSYGDSLAAVGLHPDNPDGMYQAYQKFLHAPKAFKDADPHWGGAHDGLTWYETPKGTANIEWPFGGGLWRDNAPRTEAQFRAFYKIPPNVGTLAFLAALFKFPKTITTYRLAFYQVNKSGGFDLGNALSDVQKAAQSVVSPVVNVANTLHIPGVNITAAILTGQNPIDALKADMNSFLQAGAIAKGVVSGDMHPLAQAATNAASSFGVHLDVGQVADIASAAKSGDTSKVASLAMGDGYSAAWDLATNGGTIYEPGLPPPKGKAYKPGAMAHTAAAIATHPLVVAAHAHPIKPSDIAHVTVPVNQNTLAKHFAWKRLGPYVPVAVGVALFPVLGPLAPLAGGAATVWMKLGKK